MPTTKKPPRVALKELIERSGKTQTEVGREAGYMHPSGISGLLSAKRGDNLLPYEGIRRLIPVLRGLGKPPITSDELLALSDLSPSSKSEMEATARTVDAATDRVVLRAETGGERLPLRWRVESGTFVRRDGAVRNYGVSPMCVSPQYPLGIQSCALVSGFPASVFPVGSHLHVVGRSVFPDAALSGRFVLVGVASGDLMELSVGKVVEVVGDMLRIVDGEGSQMNGEVIGVIVAAHTQV